MPSLYKIDYTVNSVCKAYPSYDEHRYVLAKDANEARQKLFSKFTYDKDLVIVKEMQEIRNIIC